MYFILDSRMVPCSLQFQKETIYRITGLHPIHGFCRSQCQHEFKMDNTYTLQADCLYEIQKQFFDASKTLVQEEHRYFIYKYPHLHKITVDVLVEMLEMFHDGD